jgi:hypothetical protein
MQGYIKRQQDAGEEPNQAYLDWWKTQREQTAEHEASEEWKQNNLEYDLRTTDWIIDKARRDDRYAQNVYAALCNQRWQKRDVMPILKDEWWHCSWRSAGGIVANMLGRGDYIDWYCSGIGGGLGNGDEDGSKNYVSEGTVTEEISNDFYQLGWVHSEWPDDEGFI